MRGSLFFLLFAIFIVSDVQCDDQDWWKNTIFYQIYPRSFKDTDGNGVGDLKGITENIEHFVDAGIGAIWLSPIYESPMVDFGYDISNFRKVDPLYGTNEDLYELIDKAHGLGIKVVLDFVPNHASNYSDYFKLSLNRTQGFENFFIWDDGLLDSDNLTRLPPTNWVSQFQGSAWEWREERQQFYLHQFSIEQPDLNYRNPKVVEEMNSVMTFWLDKGVDGFRIDAVPYLIEVEKDPITGRYPDDPLSGDPKFGPGQLGYTLPYNTKDRDESYNIVFQWKALLDNYGKRDGVYRMMLTEGYANLTCTMKYYGNKTANGSDLPFNFDFITYGNQNSTAPDIAYTALRWLTYMPPNKTANWVFGNHDNKRVASRYGENKVDGLNMLDLLLPGVAITYQGDEIGMPDGYVSWEDTVDIQALAVGPDHYLEVSRDPARTPYQWDNTTNAGFTNASKTWLPVGQDYKTLNLEAQKHGNRSHFKVYQSLAELRQSPAARKGDWTIRAITNNILVLIRTLKGHDSIVLVFNVGNEDDVANLSEFDKLPQRLDVEIVSIYSTRNPGDVVDGRSIPLKSGEALVLTAPPTPVNCLEDPDDPEGPPMPPKPKDDPKPTSTEAE